LEIVVYSAGCGRSVVREYDRRSMTEPPQQFLARLEANAIPRVPGTAVFLTRLPPPNVLEIGRQIEV
jgi:K+ transporter